jgi:tol-pal system protein YbgF
VFERLVKATAGLLFVCLAYGCATHEPVMNRLDSIEAIQRTERSESKAEYEALMRELDIILMRLDAISKNQANILDSMSGQREMIQNAVETMRHSRRSAQEPPMPGRFTSQPTAADHPDESDHTIRPDMQSEQRPEAVYQTAYNDYLSRNYDLAIVAFRNFLTAFPASELAANAQYWIAECYYAQKQYEHALNEFHNVVTLYPQSSKYLPALLKKGLTYIHMDNAAQGRAVLESLIENYPYSSEARIAQDRLQND